MKTKSKNKLKIFAGVGAAHEISADVAAEYSGSVGDALSEKDFSKQHTLQHSSK